MKKSIFEMGTATNRNLIAIIIIGLTIIAIALISIFYFSYAPSDEKGETAEQIFNALLPMFATWVGTVLAFYFGRENFEAASNRYEQILTSLTPDVLDDISIEQIMIDVRTMVYMDLEDVKAKSVSELVDFMENVVSKSRLPILENKKIKYIIHKSTFTDAIRKNPNIELQFHDFISYDNIESLVTNFITAGKKESLETIQKRLNEEKNCKDVFVVDEKEELLGWLTDTLILKYLNKNRSI